MSIVLTAGYLELLQLTKFALKAENQTVRAGEHKTVLEKAFVHTNHR